MSDSIKTARSAGGLARFLPGRQSLPLLATLVVCVVLYVTAGLMFDGFFSAQVFADFFGDNAFLGVAALGESLVILSGGIDLSVGSMISCSSIAMATLIETYGWPFPAAAALVVACGTGFGALMGWIIHRYAVAPFLVTLGGLFVLGGLALRISNASIAIKSPLVIELAARSLPLGGADLRLTGVVFLGLAAILTLLMRYTAFGRNVYAIGGSEPSALLMGLPVGRTKVGVYALSGLLGATAGVVYTISLAGGNANAGVGLELDAIAAVVVGGTLLSGGVGYIPGTVLGVLVFGIIQTAINFQGNLDNAWARICIGGLLLVFITLQRLIAKKRA